MKSLYALILSVAITLPALAQKTLPYLVDFDTKEQQDEWQQYRMGITEFYEWSFATSENGFVSHDYPVGASSTDTTRDWLVSPAIDLSNGAEIALSVNGFALIGLTDDDYFGIWVSTGSADPADGDYVEVADLTAFSTQGEYKDTSGLDLKSLALDGHVALVYEATQNWFTVAVDDIEIKASTTGIEKPSTALNAAVWYGNNGAELTLNEIEGVQYTVTDLGGRLMARGTLASTRTQLGELASFTQGMYVVSLASAKGSYSSKFLVR